MRERQFFDFGSQPPSYGPARAARELGVSRALIYKLEREVLPDGARRTDGRRARRSFTAEDVERMRAALARRRLPATPNSFEVGRRIGAASRSALRELRDLCLELERRGGLTAVRQALAPVVDMSEEELRFTLHPPPGLGRISWRQRGEARERVRYFVQVYGSAPRKRAKE